MATAQTIQEKTAKYILNVTRLDQIINGPASGPESVVQLDDGISKTLRRVLLEMGAPVNVVQWSSTATYTKGTWVYYNGNTYYARQDVPAGILPGSNGLYWQLVAQGEATIVDVVQQALVLAQEAEARVGEAETTIAEILANVTTLQTELNEFQSELNQLSEDLAAGGVPEYDAATAYVIGDVVVYDGKMYRAKAATTGNLPTNLTYWDKVGDYATLGQNMGVQAWQISDHETRITTNGNAITAESAARTTLAAQLRGTYTGIDPNALTQGLLYNERVARVTADQANASETTGVKTRLDNAEFAISGQSSAITTLNSRVSSVEGVNASQSSAITQLQTDLNGKASASALSALDARTTQTENALSTQASSLTTLRAEQVGSGDNALVNSTLEDGFVGWVEAGNGNVGLPINRGRNGPSVDFWGVRNNFWATAAGTPSAGLAFDLYRTKWDGFEGLRRYCMEVTSGDRVFASCRAAMHRAAAIQLNLVYFRSDGSFILETVAAQGGRLDGGYKADPANMDRIGGFNTVPSDAKWVGLYFRVITDGGHNPYGFVTEPMLTKATANQTAWPSYSPGRSDPIKASSEAVQALDARTTQTETTLSTQASAITSLQGDVAGKASVSITNALDARITQTEGTLSTTVSSVSQLTTTVNGHTGTITSLSQVQADQAGILAQTVSLTMVDGKVSGTINRNNGQTTSFQVLADNFSIVSTNTGARTEYSNGHWRVYDSAGVLRVRMGVWAP